MSGESLLTGCGQTEGAGSGGAVSCQGTLLLISWPFPSWGAGSFPNKPGSGAFGALRRLDH